MYQQVGKHQHGVVFILADDHIRRRAVLFHQDAVDGHGLSHPLVLFDAAVIVGVQISLAVALIQGVLLHIHPGRVDVGAQDVHAVLQGLLAQLEQGQGLVHADGVDLVAGDHAAAAAQGGLQRHIAGGLCQTDGLRHAFPLGLALVQKGLIARVQGFQSLQVGGGIFFPCGFVFHGQ